MLLLVLGLAFVGFNWWLFAVWVFDLMLSDCFNFDCLVLAIVDFWF